MTADRKTVEELKAVLGGVLSPVAGGWYRHQNGGTYEVEVVSLDEATHEPLVTYRNLETRLVWTRPVADFNAQSIVGGRLVSRFVRVDRPDAFPPDGGAA